jgi:FkbM family methyltransferase
VISTINVSGVSWQLEHTNDHIGRQLAAGNFYERAMLDDMRVRVKSGLAVDCGAHIGNHTVWLAGVCGLHVLAIEPVPANFSIITRNVLLNDLGGRITMVNRALSNVPGEMRIVAYDKANTGATHLEKRAAGSIKAVTLDSLDIAGATLLKIDVEGMELEVLAGGEGLINRSHPVVYLETDALDAVEAWMSDHGYVRFAQFCRKNHYGFAYQGGAR